MHYEELKKIATFTKGTADSLGVAVEITCAMQYFLRPEDLKDLHQQYDLYYKYGFINFFLASYCPSLYFCVGQVRISGPKEGLERR